MRMREIAIEMYWEVRMPIILGKLEESRMPIKLGRREYVSRGKQQYS